MTHEIDFAAFHSQLSARRFYIFFKGFFFFFCVLFERLLRQLMGSFVIITLITEPHVKKLGNLCFSQIIWE